MKKLKKAALHGLDAAQAEYDELYQSYSEVCAELDEERDLSLPIITKVEELAASIRNKPVPIGETLEKITEEKKEFTNSAELIRQERKEKMAASAGMVVLLAAGTAVASSFWEFAVSFVESIIGEKDDKGLVDWAIILIIIAVCSIFLYIFWRAIRSKTVKKAVKNTEEIKKETNIIKIQQETIKALLVKIKRQRSIVNQFYDNLRCYSYANFMSIPEEKRSDLIALVNHTYSLSSLLNAKTIKEDK